MAFIYKKITNEGKNFTYIYSRYLPHSYFSNSMPFPYSAMLLGHDCQTTWHNMEMDMNNLEMYRNLNGTIYTSTVQKKETVSASECMILGS